MPDYSYRPIIGARDQLIVDAQTGAILGLRSDNEINMINGVSDNVSGMGGGLKTVAGRNITIPDASQAIAIGGVTISSGSITTAGTGELVALAY